MTDGKEWLQAQTDAVGHAIRELRGDRSAQWVSDATAELGYRVTRALITDLELGRRRYIAAHELVMLSAALGVTPATLLTWGQMPDGDVELMPGRTLSAMDAAGFWGGTPISRFNPAAQGLPRDHQASEELFRAARERARLRDTLIRTQIGGLTEYPDPALLPAIRDRLKGVIARIRELGGVIRDTD